MSPSTPWLAWRLHPRMIPPLVALGLGALLLLAGGHWLAPAFLPVLLWTIYAGLGVLALSHMGAERLGVGDRNGLPAIALGALLGLLLGAIRLYQAILEGASLNAPPFTLSTLAFLVTLAALVAGEELLYRGWLLAALGPGLGRLPTLILSALAFACAPSLLLWASPSLAELVPEGYLAPLTARPLTLFLVGLFLGGIVQFTGSLWASGSASFICRLSLVFFLQPGWLSVPAPLGIAIGVVLLATMFLAGQRRAAPPKS